MHHAPEIGHAELHLLVQYLISHPIDMTLDRDVVMNLQFVRAQIQHPLHGAMAAPDHEPIHHALHLSQYPRRPGARMALVAVAAAGIAVAGTAPAGIASTSSSVITLLSCLLHHHHATDLDHGRQYGRVSIGPHPSILVNPQHGQRAHQWAVVFMPGD